MVEVVRNDVERLQKLVCDRALLCVTRLKEGPSWRPTWFFLESVTGTRA